MLYPIEIKTNLEGGVADALGVLGNPVPSPKRMIWFAEDADGLANDELRLHAGGIIVRIRSQEGPDDSTVKLRPCEPSGWVAPWESPFETDLLEFRVESDWSGLRRSVAASVVATFGQGSLARAGSGAPLHAGTLTDSQLSFIATCTGVRIVPERLVTLGPIVATKWNDLPLARMKVDAERWTVEGMDFLEFSVRVRPNDHDDQFDLNTRAEKRQAELVAAITDFGLQVATNTDNKTQRVLTALATRKQQGATDV